MFEVYRFKWMRVSGTLSDVTDSEYFITVSLNEFIGTPSVYLRFDPSFGPQLVHLRKNTPLVVLGEIQQAVLTTSRWFTVNCPHYPASFGG